jgi:hypothetical protein
MTDPERHLVAAPPGDRYRTGRTVPNTLYDGDVFIGSAITGHKAAQLVEAANGGLKAAPLLAAWDDFDLTDYAEDSEAIAALVDLVEPWIESLRPAPDGGT